MSQQPRVATQPFTMVDVYPLMSFVDFAMAIMFEVRVARKMTRSQLNTTENKVSWNKNQGIQVGSCGCRAGMK